MQFILRPLSLLHDARPSKLSASIDTLLRGLSISECIFHGRVLPTTTLVYGPWNADKSSKRRAEHLRRGVPLLSRSPGPYPSIYSSSREHVRVARIREASTKKGAGRSARETNAPAPVRTRCIHGSLGSANYGEWNAGRCYQAASRERERENGPSASLSIYAQGIPPNVADFVCSRVRRVGAFERRPIAENCSDSRRETLPFLNYRNLLRDISSLINFTSQWNYDAELDGVKFETCARNATR